MYSTDAPLTLDEYTNISYVSHPAGSHDPLHEFDLYVPSTQGEQGTPLARPERPPLICFVHGGAWRSEDKADHAQLARRLARHTHFPVAVPNYRLTTPVTLTRHPAHAEDTLAFLHFLLTWGGPSLMSVPGSDENTTETRAPYDPAKLYLLGHSCSAHMLTSIFLSPPTSASSPPDNLDREPSTPPPSSSQPRAPSPSPSPLPSPNDSLAPSPSLLASTRALVLSEGIYDLDALLRTFPAYKTWFVAPTFGRLQSYEPWNTASYELRDGGEHIRWLIVHSKGDTLVNRGQSEAMWGRLRSLYDEEGEKVEGRKRVERNWEDLTEEHDATLAGEVYPRIVGDWILDGVRSRGKA